MTLTMRSITLNSGSDKLLRVVVTALTNIVTSRLAWSQQPDHKQELNFKTSIPSVHHLLIYFYQQLLSQIKKKNKQHIMKLHTFLVEKVVFYLTK